MFIYNAVNKEPSGEYSMNRERNSIVINDADLCAFEIEAICEGFGFWGSPDNTGKRAVEILDSILKYSGLTHNVFKEKIQQVYQNILLYDTVYIGQELGANYWLGDTESLGVFRCHKNYLNSNSDFPNAYHTFSLNRRIPVYEAVYLEFLKPFVIPLVYNHLLRCAASNPNHELCKNQRAILYENKINLLQYIELVYDYVFTYSNATPYIVYYYMRRCNYPGYESWVAALICGYADTISINLQKSTEDDAIITGLDIALNKYIQQDVKSECYSVLKVAFEDAIGPLPVFSSLREVMEFKDKYSSSINSLKHELFNIEYLLRKNELKAINKALHDVELSAKAIRQNSKYNKPLKWLTYASFPIGIAESLLNSSFIGLGLSGAGFILQLACDYSDRKNNWLFLLRN